MVVYTQTHTLVCVCGTEHRRLLLLKMHILLCCTSCCHGCMADKVGHYTHTLTRIHTCRCTHTDQIYGHSHTLAFRFSLNKSSSRSSTCLQTHTRATHWATRAFLLCLAVFAVLQMFQHLEPVVMKTVWEAESRRNNSRKEGSKVEGNKMRRWKETK